MEFTEEEKYILSRLLRIEITTLEDRLTWHVENSLTADRREYLKGEIKKTLALRNKLGC